MTDEERKQRIESYGNAYNFLIEALQQFPPEMRKFKPKEGWSIHEIIIHIADSEVNGYVRCRRLIAEPGSRVMGYDENSWAKLLRYEDQSTEEALELFKQLRRASYHLLKSQSGSVASHTIDHSEYGLMTFDDWLNMYERHIPDHVAQMQRCYEEWKSLL